MDGLFIIAAMVALVWGVVLFFRGGPLGTCLLFLLAATCFSADFFSMGAGSLRLTADRLLWVAMMLTYLVWRQRGWSDPKPLRGPDMLLLAFVGYLAVRTLTTSGQAGESNPLVDLILWYVMPLGVFWIVRQSKISERDCAMVLGCVALFGVYLAVTVIAEKFEVYSLVYPKYIITSMTVKDAEFIGRGRGPLLHPIVTGIQLAACWAAALMLWTRGNRMFRFSLLLLSGLFALAAYSTMTRSVWMGVGLSLATIVGLSMPVRWRAPLLGCAVLMAGVLAATNWDQLVAFKRDRNLTAKETADSVALRPIMAEVAWQMVAANPLFGCGFDQYLSEHKFYLADRSSGLNLEKTRPYSAHNLLLGIVTETGLTGLALFLVVIAAWCRDAWRLWRATRAPLWARQQGLVFLAILGAYLVNGMFHHIAMIPMSNIMLFFVAGLVAALQPWTVEPN